MNFLKKIFNSKENKISSYQEFWNWFVENEKDFYKVLEEKGDVEKDFFERLSPKLKELKEGFYFLVGMKNDQTAELILTADGIVKNIVFIEELIAAAPTVSNWIFTALKPMMDINSVGLSMGEYKFNSDNIHFYYNISEQFPDEIDITLVYDDYEEELKDHLINGCYLFLDNLLGELYFATIIDNISVVGKDEAKEELVPISKLKDFIIWRQKEFVEKYDATSYEIKEDNYAMLQAELQSGNPLFAVINMDLLEWSGKVSHPWILTVEVQYDGSENNGMPSDEMLEQFYELEDELEDKLKDVDGNLYIGRQTVEGVREIYFACKEFRNSSKILHQIEKDFSEKLNLSYIMYKDKYWRSFDRFRPNS